MTDMKEFVERSQKLGVKVVLWYAVPFVGKNASMAARFKDKSLRFTPTGLAAYTLDPRYPEVREYLIDIYRTALREWKLDGFKLDFIDRFVADEQTVLEASGGRDYASVNEAADRLDDRRHRRTEEDQSGRDAGVPPALHRAADPQIREHVPRQRQPECLSDQQGEEHRPAAARRDDRRARRHDHVARDRTGREGGAAVAEHSLHGAAGLREAARRSQRNISR